ncbi:MAG TPA: radical SAM protein [Anaerolineae bacterium]|nr:radical SAM protein [Anaerolineae bacterium]
MEFAPAYLALVKSGALARRVEAAYQRMEACDICPHRCGVNRRAGERGVCRTGEQAIVASAGPHFGEEVPLVGRHGSGTIFFAWCSLCCRYCQNASISQRGEGDPVTPEALAETMLALQRRGCHNINLVTPSHVVPQILAATQIAAERGLRIPLLYNTGGYDSLETLALLDGVLDIYMPDVKYADLVVGERYSRARDYPAINQAAVREMHRQVGDLQLDERGIAQRGLLVRHLVLPEGLAGTDEIVRFLAALSKDTYLNVMAQYRPCHEAYDLPPLDRPITAAEYQEAVRMALDAGLHRLDQRQPPQLVF